MEFYCFLYLLTAGLVNICLCKFNTFSFKETLFAQDTFPVSFLGLFITVAVHCQTQGMKPSFTVITLDLLKWRKNQNINYFTKYVYMLVSVGFLLAVLKCRPTCYVYVEG